jgi:hypothetical protein
MTAMDEISAQPVQSRTSYRLTEVLGGPANLDQKGGQRGFDPTNRGNGADMYGRFDGRFIPGTPAILQITYGPRR